MEIKVIVLEDEVTSKLNVTQKRAILELTEKDAVKLEKKNESIHTLERKLAKANQEAYDIQEGIIVAEQEYVRRLGMGFDLFNLQTEVVVPVAIVNRDPELIVRWNDGTSTKVVATGEKFDIEKGFAMAFLKKNVYGVSAEAGYSVMSDYLTSLIIVPKETPTPITTSTTDISKLKVPALRKIAELLGLTFTTRTKKKELKELIEAHYLSEVNIELDIDFELPFSDPFDGDLTGDGQDWLGDTISTGNNDEFESGDTSISNDNSVQSTPTSDSEDE